MIITIEDIINGIADKLDDVFGFRIYMEEVEQDMEEPCFFITLLTGSTEKGLCNTYVESLFFDVQYFNDMNSRDKNLDFLQIQQRILREMEYILLEDGKTFRLNNRKIEKVSDVLHFFFDVDIRFMEIRRGVKMQDLQKEGNIKNG